MKETNVKIIVYGIVIMVLTICISAIISFYHPYTIRFEMDNNTLEAIKSINYTMIK
jgi:hypothetical protein